MSRPLATAVLAAASLLAACSAPEPRAASPEPSSPTTGATAPAPSAPPAEPAPPTLRLPRTFRPTGYRLTLAIDPAKPGFQGSVAIDGTLAESSSVVWLNARDLTVRSAHARAGGQDVALTAAQHGTDFLALRAASPLPAGAITLEIAYDGALDEKANSGGFRQKVGDDWYVYTQLEALYARRLFPGVDEPDSKVPYELTLEVPAGLVAVANTQPVGEEAAAPGVKRIRYAKTKPLPTYLLAFAVGPLELVDAGKTSAGAPIRIIAPRGRSKDGAYAAEVTPKIATILEQWFGIPYPYDKLDSVAIPTTVGFGAMENAGLITYRESLLLIRPADMSWNRKVKYASVGAHEMSHQWFGDLVTTAWWDDIWLNEGFATWMTNKAVERLAPEWKLSLASVEQRNGALGADSLGTARMVRQPITTIDDVYNAFDGITYSKGASVLRMFERWVGPDVFQKGVRAYLAKHAWGNATVTDFVAAIGEAAGRDVATPMSTFLDQSGAPRVFATMECSGGVGKQPYKATVTLTQERYLPKGATGDGKPRLWQVPVCIAYDRGGQRADRCELLTAPQQKVELEASSCPGWLYPNAGAVGFYRSALEAARVGQVVDHGWKHLTAEERLALFDDMRSMVARGELGLGLAIDTVPAMLRAQDRFSVGAAVELATSLEALLPPGLEPGWRAWILKTFGPAARKLGWKPRKGDDLDAETIRGALVHLVADAGDEGLRKEAVRLAKNWKALPASTRVHVLAIAADADAATFQAVREAALVEPDRVVRADLLNALTSGRDPKRVRDALALMLDDRLDVRDTEYIYHPALGHPAQRAVVEAYARDNLDKILARVPVETAARHVKLFTSACDGARRDEIAALAQQRFASFPGGQRTVAQAVETLDQCIAQRALLADQLQRAFGTDRAPRGPTPPLP